MVEDLLAQSYYALAIGQDDRAVGFQLLAGQVYDHYQAETSANPRTRLSPFNDLKRTALNDLLDPQKGLPYAARAVLRTELGLPAETNAPPQAVSTNAIAPAVLSPSTNSPATNSAGK